MPPTKDPQHGPDHGPAFEPAGSIGLRRVIAQPQGIAGHRQALALPFRQPQGIAVHVFITQLDGHPGRRVAPDSGQARSVKHHQPVLVRPQ